MPCAYTHKPLHHHPLTLIKPYFASPLSHFLDEGLLACVDYATYQCINATIKSKRTTSQVLSMITTPGYVLYYFIKFMSLKPAVSYNLLLLNGQAVHYRIIISAKLSPRALDILREFNVTV